MQDKWRIIYFETSNGGYPVFDFIEGLDEKSKAKVVNAIDLLDEYGIKLGAPHVKKIIGTDIWELRMLGEDNIRIFYIAVTGRTFLLLHAFKKKKQKTDKKEIKIAISRLKEYLRKV